MPTICSACGRTNGRCQSCIKVDAAIAAHEVPAASIVIFKAVKKVMGAKSASIDLNKVRAAAKLAKKGVRNGQ